MGIESVRNSQAVPPSAPLPVPQETQATGATVPLDRWKLSPGGSATSSRQGTSTVGMDEASRVRAALQSLNNPTFARGTSDEGTMRLTGPGEAPRGSEFRLPTAIETDLADDTHLRIEPEFHRGVGVSVGLKKTF